MNKKILGFAKLLISVSLIWYLLSIVDIGKILVDFQNIHVGYIVIALALLIFQVALSAFKWKLILRADGIPAPYLLLLRSYYIGNFLSLFLPSSFGGDVYRVYALSTINKKLAKTTSSVLFDRLTGLFALLTIGLFSFVFVRQDLYAAGLLLLYVAGLAAFFVATSKRASAIVARSDGRVAGMLASLIESFRAYRQNGAVFVRVIAISLLFQFMVVVVNKIYTLALSIDVPFSELLMVVPLIYLTEVLPISINGIGVRDSAFVFFFVTLGYSSEQGLAVAFLVLVMRYTSGLIGGAVLAGSVLRQHFTSKKVELDQ